ncbi:MAG: N-acetyltransferase [Planctomycetota bacterium]|nr:N-acetyltransferase [Planctomycetota bacterium]
MSTPILQPFSGDPGPLHDLLSGAWSAGLAHLHLHPGDVHWRLRLHPGRDPREEVALLHRGPELVGFAFMEGTGEGDFWTQPHSEQAASEALLLDWMESRARRSGEARLTVGAFDGDERRAALLASRGYGQVEAGLVPMFVELGGRAPSNLPTRARVDPLGRLELRPVRPSDFPSLATTIAAAFGTRPKPIETYVGLHASPYHDGELDLVVADPNLGVVAACTAWYDPGSRTGLVEPVSCLASHRRQGLARTLVTEALARLQARGARTVHLNTTHENEGARCLYRGLGFQATGFDRDWVLDLGGA